MLFRGPQIAVFVDGCFWHRCPIHGTLPVHNRDWWRVKLDGNVARDQRVDRLLSEHGWLALRFWEHEPTDQALALLRAAIAERAPR
jgi:DNA mismatch endonuclease (patch repair protein)